LLFEEEKTADIVVQLHLHANSGAVFGVMKMEQTHCILFAFFHA